VTCGCFSLSGKSVRTGCESGAVVCCNPVTGAQASCVASAVRRVHVPAFSQPTFSVTYPFALQ
jgi:hypothetical protein